MDFLSASSPPPPPGPYISNNQMDPRRFLIMSYHVRRDARKIVRKNVRRDARNNVRLFATATICALPRSAVARVSCRTSSAIWLGRVFPARPQPRSSAASVPARPQPQGKIGQIERQIERQKICDEECQKMC